ncbi:MAG: SusC/RagA family TonB-linked outer membrane protein [Daejeonella sp.]|uniref:SusC/RagA family TonB-linked outer membrane protein n=1 Tax=Daejeonella sp. JGW-45 TaxID=3034148 RepID=UPI0023ED3E0C|nr:SusC/RagA family TonB-linked outer membrane protein [Daejeonella sp. JGW-45]
MQLRLAFFIVLTTSIQLFSAPPVKSQAIDKVEIKLELKSESLIKAFQKIEKQSPFQFMYRYADVKDVNKLEMTAEKMSVANVLKELLSNTSLDFKQVDNRIMIVNSQKGLDVHRLTENDVTRLLDIVVRGQIKDAKGETLPGVSVKVKGTEIGASSDADGRFSLSVPENATLVFTYIGYNTKEVAVNNQEMINVTLDQSSTSLNEVVVTALGIKRESKSLTYATQGVNAEELTETRTLNVVNALQGKVAGMSIETAGTGLGGTARVVLRGNRSISGGSGPLYVVDGVPMTTAISNFSPDNIESINVLKGPNAAALYGSAAQNGVIIIETKKGKEGQVQISVNETFQTGRPLLYFEPQNEYGQGVSGVYNPTSEESWGPKMTGQMVPHWSAAPGLAGTQYAFLPQSNNYRDALRNSTYLTHNVNATVGSATTQTAFSYTREDAKGMLETNELRRDNATVRVTSKLKSWLSLDTKLNYIRNEIDNQNGTGDNAANNPFMNIYRMPRNIAIGDLRQFEYTDAAGNNKQNYWNPGSTIGRNPFWIMNRVVNYATTDRIIALASATIDFTPNLKLMARSSFDGGSGTNERKAWIDSYGGGQDNFGSYSASISGPGQVWNHDAILSFNDDITKNLNVSALAGGTLRKYNGSGSISASTQQGLTIPNFFSFGNTPLTQGAFNPSTREELQSVYFSANFGWKNLLYLDVTGRNDWSSTLPANSRSYFYPSVGISTILTDLIPGLPDVFSYSKLRASYAKVGSGASPYQLSRSATFAGTGGNFGFITLGATLPNANLKPETTEGYEIGLDTRLFNSRLGLDITAYKTNTFDQLFTISLPSGSGAASFFTNGGDVQNTGIEVVLSATPVQNANGLTWDISSNFGKNRNWVNKISDDRPRIIVGGDSYMSDFVVAQGQEFGNIYTRGWARNAQGQVIVGANGIPTLTAGRTVLAANFNPDWMGAITNNFSYKNFDFGFLIEHRQGGSMVSITDGLLYGEGITRETLAGRDGGLVFGENLFPNETGVLASGAPNTTAITSQAFWRLIGGRNAPIGEAFITSATNTRVREATLGFTFPKSMLNKIGFISGVKLSLVGRNLFFLKKTGNWDPEILSGAGTASAGFQTYVQPTERTFGLNLKVDF